MGHGTAHRISVIAFVGMVCACAAPLETRPTAFADPAALPCQAELNGLIVGLEVLGTRQLSEAAFNTDLAEAGILPVRLIAKNAGSHEFEIDARQVFGVLPDGRLVQALNLRQAADEVRASSIGTTMATGTAVGALAGAAIGAGIGAGIGGAAGDTGKGAASGAAIGGTSGAATGAAAGASDRITIEFRRQLAEAQFGDRVLFPGDIDQGFVFLPRVDYSKLRLVIVDITDRTHRDLTLEIR